MTGIEETIITIDGPAGAGKSTVSRMLAHKLGYLYLDTGAMYRVVALEVQGKKIDPSNDGALEEICRGLDISFLENKSGQRVFSRGEDVTEKIREPEIGWLASTVSMKKPVREALVRLQRQIGAQGDVVAEGRDMGTVVFPRAKYKFFLSAAPAERARRRYLELRGKGAKVKLAEIEKEMRERDEQDASRRLAPLRPAKDARNIDSTGVSPEEVVHQILKVLQDPDRL